MVSALAQTRSTVVGGAALMSHPGTLAVDVEISKVRSAIMSTHAAIEQREGALVQLRMQMAQLNAQVHGLQLARAVHARSVSSAASAPVFASTPRQSPTPLPRGENQATPWATVSPEAQGLGMGLAARLGLGAT